VFAGCNVRVWIGSPSLRHDLSDLLSDRSVLHQQALADSLRTDCFSGAACQVWKEKELRKRAELLKHKTVVLISCLCC